MQMHAPLGWGDQPAHHFDRCGLARAVGSQQPHYLADWYSQVEVIDGADRCILATVVDLAERVELKGKRTGDQAETLSPCHHLSFSET